MTENQRIGVGRTAEIYQYGVGQVVKLFRSGTPQSDVDREFALSTFAASAGVPTPRPTGLVDQNGRKGIVFQQVSGPTMLAALSKNPWSLSRQAKVLAHLHSQVHRHQAGPGLPRQVDILSNWIDKAPLLTDSEKERVLSYLGSLQPGEQLCHGDFHPDNIIIGDREWIIDWLNGMSGNPSGDVARTVLLLSFGSLPEGTPAVLRLALNAMRRRLCRKYIAAYPKPAQINFEPWLLPVAAARLKENLPEQEKSMLLDFVRQQLASHN